MTSLFRTATFRLTLLYAGVFTASLVALMGIGYLAGIWWLENGIRARIDEEIERLTAAHGEQLPADFAAIITGREDDPDASALAFLLQGPDGTALAGDIPPREPVQGWQQIVLPDMDEDEPFLARGVALSGRLFMLVAHEAEAMTDAREFVVTGLVWIIVIALPLSLVGGLIMSRVTLGRIEAINRTARQITSGNLDRRVPLRGSGDEFDRLAGNINAMLDSIQDLTEGLRQVTADIAHDLRTPLTRLRQGLETAQRKARTTDDFETAINRSIRQTDTILTTFGALLRIPQIEAGTRRASFKALDLSAVCRDLVDTFSAVAEDGGRELIGVIDDDVRISGDRELLMQMLANLIENALQHTPGGTFVTVNLTRQNRAARLSVADNGPGIPPWSRAKVLDRFYRLDASRGTGGSGLGLSIVAAIAKLHGVEMELGDNEPGLVVTMDFSTTTAR